MSDKFSSWTSDTACRVSEEVVRLDYLKFESNTIDHAICKISSTKRHNEVDLLLINSDAPAPSAECSDANASGTVGGKSPGLVFACTVSGSNSGILLFPRVTPLPDHLPTLVCYLIYF